MNHFKTQPMKRTKNLRKLMVHLSRIQNIILAENQSFKIHVMQEKEEPRKYFEWINIHLDGPEITWEILEPLSKYCIENNINWAISIQSQGDNEGHHLMVEISIPG